MRSKRSRLISLPPPSVLFDDDAADASFAARFAHDSSDDDAAPETSTSHSPTGEVHTVLSSRGRVLVVPPDSELPLPPGVRRPPSPIAEGSLRLTPIEAAGDSAGVFTERSRTLRSMLKNFLTNEYGTLNPMVDLAQHQIDSGVPVTDATVQEVTRFHPTMTGMSLRDCGAISDVGLWALAKRAAEQLLELDVEGVEQITHIGLRALSLRCDRLQRLNMTRCVQLNDLGLRVIAAGLVHLTHLQLRDCVQVTDHSLVEVARCCERLRLLDLHGCTRCCEYGDQFLVELARHCPKLNSLDLTGCTHVRAGGLRALANGCPLVHTLRLAHTGAGKTPARKGHEHVICAIARGMPSLTVLDLNGFSAPTNRDWKEIGDNLPDLRSLLLENCSKLRSSAIGKIGNGCMHLRELDLQGCARFGPASASALAESDVSTALTSLDVRRCPHLNATSLQAIAAKCSRLTTLYATPTAHLGGVEAVFKIAEDLPFVLAAVEDVSLRPDASMRNGDSDTSDDDADGDVDYEKNLELQLEELAAIESGADKLPKWCGWVAKSNALALIAAEERRRIEHAAALEIQSIYARFVARKYMVELAMKAKQLWVVPKFQALWWGHLARREVAAMRQAIRAAVSAVIITSLWWGYKVRVEVARRRRIFMIQGNKELAAVVMQKGFRGKLGRRKVATMRRRIALGKTRSSLKLTLRIDAARTIQKIWEIYLGKGLAHMAARAKEILALEAEELLFAAKLVQKAWRCRGARDIMRMRKAAVAAMKQDKSVRLVQRRYRGLIARRIYAEKRKARDYEIFLNAEATKIQNRWRIHRSGYVKSMLGRMRAARKLEDIAASLIQRAYRGYQGRGIFAAMRLAKEEMAKKDHAASVIQNCFRGFKAREASEVMRALAKVAEETRPITERIEGLEALRLEIVEELEECQSELETGTAEIAQLRMELREVEMVKTQFYDSARITGAPQRYRTSFLVRTLRDQIEEMEGSLAELPDAIGELTAKVRTKDREIRAAKRELRPIQERARQQTRAARRQRLKETIKATHGGAVGMQKLWRGYTVRSVLGEVDINELMCWIEAWDEERAQPYFYNTFSEETKWDVPQELQLLGIVPAQVDTSDPWMDCWDEASGCPYYFNSTTQEYRWEDPRIVEAFAPEGKGYGEGREWWDGQLEGGEQALALLSARSNSTGLEVHEWEELQDPDTGYAYYQHRETGEVAWSLPPQVAARGSGARIGNFIDSPTHRSENGDAMSYIDDDGTATEYSRGTSRESRVRRGSIVGSEGGLGSTFGGGGVGGGELNRTELAEQGRMDRRLAAQDEKRRLDAAWVQSVDETTGETYHFNTITEEASWEGPKLLLPPHSAGSAMENWSASNEGLGGGDGDGGGGDDDDWRGGGGGGDGLNGEDDWRGGGSGGDDDNAQFASETYEESEAETTNTEMYSEVADFEGEEEEEDAEPHEWEACATEEGVPYWYDALSGESTWTQPRDFVEQTAAYDEYGTAEYGSSSQLSPEQIALLPMPEGWEAIEDPDGNGTYFYNTFDGTTTWDDPRTDEVETNDGALPVGNNDGYGGYDDGGDARPTTVRSELALAAQEVSVESAQQQLTEWEVVDDGAGSTYYYNPTTGETQWEAPPGWDENATAVAAAVLGETAEWGGESAYDDAAALLPYGWEAVDDGEGGEYFYNAQTGESVWERPLA